MVRGLVVLLEHIILIRRPQKFLSRPIAFQELYQVILVLRDFVKEVLHLLLTDLELTLDLGQEVIPETLWLVEGLSAGEGSFAAKVCGNLQILASW